MKNCSALNQFPFQSLGVHKIAIMRKCQTAFYIRQNKRLGIFSNRRSGCRIAHMSDSNVPTHFMKSFLAKYFTDQTQILVKFYISNRTFGIGYCKSAGLLSTMLQRCKTIINRCCHIISIQIVDSKDAAFFFNFCHLSSSLVLIYVFQTKKIIIKEAHLSSALFSILSRTFLGFCKNILEFFFKKYIDKSVFLSILHDIKQRRFGFYRNVNLRRLFCYKSPGQRLCRNASWLGFRHRHWTG